MKISSVQIQGYRCIAELEIDFDDLTAFVGSGGVGKSTILNALDWFFHGGDLEDRDRHRGPEAEEPVSEVMVAVTFGDLNGADREVLGAYVEGASTTLTRSWTKEDGQKLSGNALVLPEFKQVRAADGALELRKRYRELHDEKGNELGLPEPAANADAVKKNMEVWERENPVKCKSEPSDARHLGGFTGTPLLASRFDYVLVSATANAAEAMGSGRGSVLERLLSVMEELSAESQERIEKLQREAQEEIEKVVVAARGGELVSIGSGLTKRVRDYFPGAAVKLSDEVAPPRPPQISVRAQVSDRGGHAIDPELQGHGLQRALVIALLHELAESEISAAGDGDGGEPRALMLAVEEPELYQHPLQARALAKSLAELAKKDGARPMQVAYSTHSPYFSEPAMFADLRLCRRDAAGANSCVAADEAEIKGAVADAGYGGETGVRIEAAMATSLREAIFAAAVLLCEGPSDAALMEGVAALQGGLDRDGVAVAECANKSSLGIAIAILRQLGIPCFALFDADAVNAKEDEAALNQRLLTLCEEEPEEWPAREVRQRSANFADTMESDLATIWTGFEEILEQVAEELGVKGDKKVRAYGEAVARAGEPPGFLTEVLDAARALG